MPVPTHHRLPLPGRRRISRPHWSYSQLSQWLRCPLQFCFDRILRLPKPFVPSGLAFGSAIHETLAFYHRSLQAGSGVSPRQINDAFLLSWKRRQQEEPIQYRGGECSAALVDMGVALLYRYMEEPPPSEIVGVEQELIIPLFNSQGEFLEKPLVAVIDLLCREEDALQVLEFKTSKRKFGEADVKNSLQGGCYAHAVSEAYDEPVRVKYKVLVKTKTPQVQELEVPSSGINPGRLGDTIQTVERAIEAKAFYPVESVLNCSGCPFREPCRRWQGENTTVHQVSLPTQREAATC